MAIIAASILDADFSRLENEVTRVADAGVDAFSLDVIDGHFAPRVTFGEDVVAQVRSWVGLPIEVHLMVDRPENWVQGMCDAGADMVLFHVEATDQAEEVIAVVRSEGRRVGVAIKEETPLAELSDELLSAVDLVNLLSVPIGFGGSPSAPDTFSRIRDLRGRSIAGGLGFAIEVDGGVKPENADRYVDAGADMLTVGTGIYHAPDAAKAVAQLRESTSGAMDGVSRERLAGFLSVPSSQPSRQA